MPLLTSRQVGTGFDGTQSGWPSITGTETLTPYAVVSDSGPSASQNYTYSTSSGIGSATFSQPAFGNTLINFATATSATSISTTPAQAGANRLILIAVASSVASGTANTPTLSGAGVSNWTQVSTQALGQRKLTVFAGSSASPTTANIVADFAAQSQTRIYIWGYDFINTALVASTAYAGAVAATSSSSNSVTVTPSTSTFSSSQYIYFGQRNTATTPTSTTSHWLALNSFGVGDFISNSTPGSFTFASTAGNIAIGLYIAPYTNSGATTKIYLCSSGTTPASFQHGTIDFSLPAPVGPKLTASPVPSSIFFWAPMSTAVSTVNQGYYANVSYTSSKGFDNVSGTADDISTLTFSLVKRDSLGSQTTLASASVNEITGTTNYRPVGEIWNFKLNIAKLNSTQSTLSLSWDLPPFGASTTRVRGSISAVETTSTTDLSFGIFQGSSSSTLCSPLIDSLYISDTTMVPSNIRIQSVARSVNW